MQGQWEHRWRYDGNGQPFLQLKGRWWRLERQAGSRQLVTFYDTENKLRPGLAYVYTPPAEWPVDEARLALPRSLSLLALPQNATSRAA